MEHPPAQKSTTADASRYLRDVFPGGLDEGEVFWRDHQPWLEKHGYMLRPRYHFEWTPSWINSKRPRLECEDGQTSLLKDKLIDARRITDGAVVLLKKVD
ncbi:hypothetical protein MPER_11813, partial [Moniliophthora perniciosa FA553]